MEFIFCLVLIEVLKQVCFVFIATFCFVYVPSLFACKTLYNAMLKDTILLYFRILVLGIFYFLIVFECFYVYLFS